MLDMFAISTPITIVFPSYNFEHHDHNGSILEDLNIVGCSQTLGINFIREPDSSVRSSQELRLYTNKLHLFHILDLQAKLATYKSSWLFLTAVVFRLVCISFLYLFPWSRWQIVQELKNMQMFYLFRSVVLCIS